MCSYSRALSGKGRLFQPDNPEIELTKTTGLLYLDAIAQLKNVTKQLEECAYNVEGCSIKLCNRTIPSPSDYDLSSEERYAEFSVTATSSSGKLIVKRIFYKHIISIFSLSFPSRNLTTQYLSFSNECNFQEILSGTIDFLHEIHLY